MRFKKAVQVESSIFNLHSFLVFEVQSPAKKWQELQKVVRKSGINDEKSYEKV